MNVVYFLHEIDHSFVSFYGEERDFVIVSIDFVSPLNYCHSLIWKMVIKCSINIYMIWELKIIILDLIKTNNE